MTQGKSLQGSLCYLSGIDWMLHALDASSKKATGCGNICQVILHLDTALNPTVLENKLESFLKYFPMIEGQANRNWNLAPYWKYEQERLFEFSFTSITAVSDAKALTTIHHAVNIPFTHEREHLRFLQVKVDTHAYFALVFDHRLFDARGAETFLYLFHQYYIGAYSPTAPLSLVRPSGLSGWKNKFLAGQRVNRYFNTLTKDICVQALALPTKLNNKKFMFKTHSFNFAASHDITQSAYTHAGYLMMAPYLLACSLLAFKDTLHHKLDQGDHFIIPVNTDIRARKPELTELFFNHLSFLFLKFTPKEIMPTQDFISHTSRLLYDAIKSGIAQDLMQAGLLLRIIPAHLIEVIQQQLMRLKKFTFSFSYVNKGYEGLEFCDAKVLMVTHTPRVSINPGIGIFFTHFNGCISVTISFLEDIISQEEADLLMSKLQKNLLSPFNPSTRSSI